jgi:ParB family chromosome partitioning protein
MQGSKLMRLAPSKIIVNNRIREVNEDAVKALVSSIKEIGLLSPIRIHWSDRGSPVVIHGRHRLEAVRQLGWNKIDCVVHEFDDDLGEAQREAIVKIAEIDENIVRNNPGPAETAMMLAERKIQYEVLHPETKNGANQHTRVRNNCEPSNQRFTAATAKATGKSERTIQNAVKAGLKIDPEALKLLAGDKNLDKVVEMDRLSKIPREEQLEVVKKSKAGGPSPREFLRQNPAPITAATSMLNKYLKVGWRDASEAERSAFLKWVGAEEVVRYIEMMDHR